MSNGNQTVVGAIEDLAQQIRRYNDQLHPLIALLQHIIQLLNRPQEPVVQPIEEVAKTLQSYLSGQLDPIIGRLNEIDQHVEQVKESVAQPVASIAVPVSPDETHERVPIMAAAPEGDFIEIAETPVYYIDEGNRRSRPVLFLHGNLASSYTWRHAIHHLRPLGRCIAPDMVGFGRSGKPDIDYSFFDQANYLEAFIDALELENITFVMHEWGSGLGFHYAMQHEDKVRGLAFVEPFIQPFDDWDAFPSSSAEPQTRQFFQGLREGDEGGPGWQRLHALDPLIDQLVPPFVLPRTISPEELAQYRAPFVDAPDYKPLWRLTKDIPIAGEPADVAEAVLAYSDKLRQSEIPKLLLYGSPGTLMDAARVQWCRHYLLELETVDLGEGSLFLHEAHPHQFGIDLAIWYSETVRRGR